MGVDPGVNSDDKSDIDLFRGDAKEDPAMAELSDQQPAGILNIKW